MIYYVKFILMIFPRDVLLLEYFMDIIMYTNILHIYYALKYTMMCN
jgi:hypothetical protein